MTIKVGDQIPSVTLKKLGESGMEDINTAELFNGKKIVMFAVPGAFTPTCAEKHLPDYVQHSDEIFEKGVDQIICLAVNDPFVMKHWGETSGAGDKIMMLPDGNAEFVTAMGLDMDGSGFGLGTRATRFLMIVENGVVKELEVEENPGDLVSAAAGVCLSRL